MEFMNLISKKNYKINLSFDNNQDKKEINLEEKNAKIFNYLSDINKDELGKYDTKLLKNFIE